MSGRKGASGELYPEGINVETRGQSVPVSAGEAALLLRVCYAPGSHIPPHTDPGTGVWMVERGTIGFAVQEGVAQVSRAGTTGTEPVTAGMGGTLTPGDTASSGPEDVHTTRNAGDGEASIHIGGVYATEQPLVRPHQA